MQVVKITLDEGEMDSYVFLLANKKVGAKMQKDMNDLVSFALIDFESAISYSWVHIYVAVVFLWVGVLANVADSNESDVKDIPSGGR